MTMNKDICCPKFNPDKWDEKTFNWENKHFIKETIPTLFHIPFPPMIGKKITSMWKMVQGAKQNEGGMADVLVLFWDPTPFKSEIYMSVKGPVEGANNTSLSGELISRVFDGPYNSIPKHLKEMEKYLEEKGKKVESNKDYYVHYAHCPKCAKDFGHNYMILFAKV